MIDRSILDKVNQFADAHGLDVELEAYRNDGSNPFIPECVGIAVTVKKQLGGELYECTLPVDSPASVAETLDRVDVWTGCIAETFRRFALGEWA